MIVDRAGTWGRLRALDDSDRLEFPAGFDPRRARERFEQLAGRFEGVFGDLCAVDRTVQDAAFHGMIEVSGKATVSGRRIIVVVSNFGDLAAVEVEALGVHDDEEIAEILASPDAETVYGALDELGYVVIRTDPLWETYDGTVAGLRERGATWWDRFFSYI